MKKFSKGNRNQPYFFSCLHKVYGFITNVWPKSALMKLLLVVFQSVIIFKGHPVTSLRKRNNRMPPDKDGKSAVKM